MPTWTVFQACHPIMHQKDSLLIFLFSSTSILDAIIPLVPRAFRCTHVMDRSSLRRVRAGFRTHN